MFRKLFTKIALSLGCIKFSAGIAVTQRNELNNMLSRCLIFQL